MAQTMAELSMVGADELDKLLRDLSPSVSLTVQRKAVRVASTPIVKAYRRHLRGAAMNVAGSRLGIKTGRLRRAPAKKVKTYRKSETVVGIIGPKARAAPHAQLVEFGTTHRYHKKTGKYVGRVLPYRPLYKAFIESLPDAKRIMRQRLAEGVRDAAVKLSRKHKTNRIRVV